MTDLNTAIAVSKGWTRDGQNGWVLFKGVGIINAKFNPPDYEHDARLYMALYFELSLKTRIVVNYQLDIENNPSNFGKLVCMAYCKLKGIEVVG